MERNSFDSAYDTYAEIIAERVAARLRPLISGPSVQTQSPVKALMPEEADFISKRRTCVILDRCDSTLRKWAERGILVPVKRSGEIFYRTSDVLKIYNEGV